jgi:small subunit ribosomal protein S17
MLQEKKKKSMTGVVVSDSMDKTIAVTIETTHIHPVVGKVVRSRKKYKVHDEQEQASVGDIVEIYEGRPVSKTKYMYLARIVTPAAGSRA